MRYAASEKAEIIELVEQSLVLVLLTLLRVQLVRCACQQNRWA
jgi:hypothetical protein